MRKTLRLAIAGIGIVTALGLTAPAGWADAPAHNRPGTSSPQAVSDLDPTGGWAFLLECLTTGSANSGVDGWCPGGKLPEGGI
ncbi:hypothetical protein [Nocardia carnea]|uniref:hypothetical protein n=1 Tax=Nocardia carnea TaxID=37328 RepID=UPI0024548F76|nr:hypothetical protein [Nocardia carnea]